MKTIRFVVSYVLILISSVVSAQTTFNYQSGQVLELPNSITVQDDEGRILSYRVPNTLKFATAINHTTYRFTPSERPPRCGTYLGQLYEVFQARAQAEGGLEFFITVQPSSQTQKVSVLGLCHIGSSTLDHIQLEVQAR